MGETFSHPILDGLRMRHVIHYEGEVHGETVSQRKLIEVVFRS